MNDILNKYPMSKGIMTINTSSFNEFQKIINCSYFKTKNQDLIYRGQGDAKWPTTSSIARILAKDPSADFFKAIHYQLNNFKASARGRRGVNPEKYNSDNEWWALGQHYDLSSPMLDFSYSPYVAAFFAFKQDLTGIDKPKDRAVLALNYKMLCKYYDLNCIDQCYRIKVYNPKMDDNPRIIAQNGLLAYIPTIDSLESIIQSCFGECNDISTCDPTLIKLLVPDYDRLDALQILQKMNITDSSIYPDLIGAAKFCNMKLKIKEY